ncbi:MAG: hypothetical protein HW405_104, partial [Candidatus Berkelbacteria bacterium]|nr:hypothetical protein [Candidatus Berkelbacteria bacterium]
EKRRCGILGDTHHGPSIGFGQMAVDERERGLAALEEAIRQRGGDPLAFMRRLPADLPFTRSLARHIVRGGSEWPDESLARRIMGPNFWGRDEWAGLGITFSGRQAKTVARFPWNEEILDSECPWNPGQAVSQTHFGFLGVKIVSKASLTIVKWQEICPAGGQPRFYQYGADCWYTNEEFATTVSLDLQWYLVLKDVVPGSTSKVWETMLGMLPPEYETPTPVVEATKDILYYKRNGVYLNPGVYAATDALDSDGYRVVVGDFRQSGLTVYNWDGEAAGALCF